MIRIGVVGLGKMGLSHYAIINTHPDVEVVAACDANSYVTDVLAKHTGLRCYAKFEEMIAQTELEAVVISTPSRSHASLVRAALERNLHVFCEKPFVLDVPEGEALVSIAETKQLANQVGYHFRFVGAFREAARVIRSGALGEIHHVRAEAYGPVVLRPTGGTWRAAKTEGGGALYDYACHVIDLINFVVDCPVAVEGAVLNRVFSRDVEDEVYCALVFANGASGQLAVNWSDESYRKMFTRISVWGSNGRVIADRQECQVFLRECCGQLPEYERGWTVRYSTELTPEVWFYLRGEEYSAQLAYFVDSIKLGRADGTNSFRSALQTDQIVANIAGNSAHPVPTRSSRGLLAKVFR